VFFFHDNYVDIWVSSLDLDEEDSELIEEEKDMGSFDANFPSPSFNAVSECEDFCKDELDKLVFDSELIEEEKDMGSFDANFPSPSFNAMSECEDFCKDELDKLVFDSDIEEPIFWPFENESYKTPDLDKFLCVSPRRNMLEMDKSVKSGLDPIKVKPHQKNNGFIDTTGNERKFVPNPEPNLTNTLTRAQQIPNMPSRLGRLSNASNDLQYKNLFPTKGARERNLIKPFKNLIQGGLRTFKESSIEKSIGLHEFDGHEGIEEHGADNDIPLCGSPWQIASVMKFGMQRIKRGTVGML
jgi:hypothetical protein